MLLVYVHEIPVYSVPLGTLITPTVSAMSYDNIPMNFVDLIADTIEPFAMEIYALAKPPAGNFPISITLSASDFAIMDAVSYYNVCTIGAMSVSQITLSYNSVSRTTYFSTTITTTTANSLVTGVLAIRGDPVTVTTDSSLNIRLFVECNNTDRSLLSYDQITNAPGNYAPGFTYVINSNSSGSGLITADFELISDDACFSPTFTPTSTITDTITATYTCTWTYTGTATITLTDTYTYTLTPTNTFTPSLIITVTNTYTDTFTATPSATPSNLATATLIITETPTISATPVITLTSTCIPTMTATNTETTTLTIIATYSCTRTYTDTPTFIMTKIFTITPTFTITNTITQTSTITPTFTVTHTFTITLTITRTATITPTMTPWPVGDLLIYPNPYNPHKGTLKFANLYPESTVFIYTISAELVITISHAGGMVIWNGKNSYGNYISSGIYYYIIANNSNGQVFTGKIFLINR